MNNKTSAFLSCLLGGLICWYDFVIFGMATAMVFGKLFFTDMSFLVPAMVFAVGFATRPIGSVIFGHLGDKFGRKPVLISTLLLTAVCTVGVGLLPTYEQIGIAAPIALVILRILQTIALGGEWAATSTIMTEYNLESNKRGFWAGMLGSTLLLASVIASAMFTLVTSFGPDEFMSWGWRVPFLFSGVLLIIGLWARAKVLETPEYIKAKTLQQTESTPIKTLFTDYWRKVVLAIATSQVSGTFYFGILFFGVTYLVNKMSMSRAELSQISLYGFALSLLVVIAYGWIADKLGDSFKGGLRMYQFNAAAGLLAAYPIFYWLSIGNFIGPMLLGVVLISMAGFSAAAVVLTEIFPTKVRQTGSGISFNVAAVFAGGLMPMAAAAILEYTGSIINVAWLFAASCVISLAASVFVTKNDPTTDQ